MKNLTVYYSEKGMTRAVAEKMAAQTGTQLFEIAEEAPKRGLFRKKAGGLKPLPRGAENGQTVFCLPVKSNGRLPARVWEFAMGNRDKLSKVSYVFVKRGGVEDMPRRITEMDELLGVTFQRAIFVDPTDEKLDEKLTAFAADLQL